MFAGHVGVDLVLDRAERRRRHDHRSYQVAATFSRASNACLRVTPQR
jgi:hypothetical protein